MQKYRYIFITCILSVILLIPFYLRQKDPRLEIYPSVILPSGAGLVQVNNNEINIKTLEIWIFKKDWQKINFEEFLGEIPSWYIYSLVEYEFGLKSKSELFTVNRIPYQFKFGNILFSDNNRSEVRSWLRKRLEILNSSYNFFIIKEAQITFDENMHFKKKEIVNEKLFDVSQ